MERYFRILDIDLTLSGPAELIDPIATAYRRFEAPSSGADSLRIMMESPQADRLHVGDRSIPLVAELDRGMQFYQGFLVALMDRVGSWAVLHAAAVVDARGDGLILAAPSGHGKSSLTLELVRRGMGFLGDDYAPLDLERHTIAPYPRAVGIVPGGAAPIPEPFAVAAADPGARSLFGKSLVDVGEVVGEEALVDRPVRLRTVVLLCSHADAGGRTRETLIDLAARREDADEVENQIADNPGVEVLETGERPNIRLWRLRLRHELRPTGALSRLLDGDKVLFFEKHWASKPDFESAPEATPILRREAAESLGRELLNRRENGRLLARYGGSVAALFLDLAGALRDASCFRVSVGACAPTADLIERLTER